MTCRISFGRYPFLVVLALALVVGVAQGNPDPQPEAPAAQAGETPEFFQVPESWQHSDRLADRRAMARDLTVYSQPRVVDTRVLQVMGMVPRHHFVPASARSLAYQDSPLSIGYGQTISQPYIVALMTELAQVGPGVRVLEVGTGSGYQTAVLVAMGAEVYSLEIVAPLARRVKETFAAVGLTQIRSQEGDGYYGWEEHAPFDRIVVTAAARHLPTPLVRQLAKGGRMVIPVGNAWGTQELLLVTKDDNGQVRTRSVLPVRFVPLIGGPDH